MIEVPSSQETSVLADWAEAWCLFGKRASISEHELERALDDAAIPDPDVAVSNVWQEIDLRHRAAGESHPVVTLSGSLERTQGWSDNLVYSFQLLLACQSHYQSTRRTRPGWRNTAKLFERVTTLALQQYLAGGAINIGAPREGAVPSGFGDCLDYLCENLNEVRGAIKLYTSRTKDDGVDVVAWSAFGDGRPGQVIVLVQCAAGADWRSKTTEISSEVWGEHINWVTEPVKAFAFPFVCVDDTLWRRLSKETAGLLLDRLRIASMFMAGADAFKAAQTELEQWCREQVPYLPWLSEIDTF